MVVFADYLGWSWAYAVSADPEENSGAVFAIGGPRLVIVASTLTEFLEGYLRDSSSLFPVW